MSKEKTDCEHSLCEHSLVDVDNEGVYGLEVCRFCGQYFKDGEPITPENKENED